MAFGVARLKATEKAGSRSRIIRSPISMIAQVRTEEGKCDLFIAIERTSKLVFREFHDRHSESITADFLRHLVDAVPDKIHTVLTDNGLQLTNPERQKYALSHFFDRLARRSISTIA